MNPTVAFKEGVHLAGLQPEMLVCIDKCAGVFAGMNITMTITSARGGRHSNYSHHYKGMALDLRVWEIIDIIDEVCVSLRNELGSDYQVFNEENHIHIEYDPKGA